MFDWFIPTIFKSKNKKKKLLPTALDEAKAVLEETKSKFLTNQSQAAYHEGLAQYYQDQVAFLEDYIANEGKFYGVEQQWNINNNS